MVGEVRMRAAIGILLAGLVLSGAMPAAEAEGDAVAALYKSKCEVCHGKDGKGQTAQGMRLGAHDFRAPEVVKVSDDVLVDVVRKGKNRTMPAYAQKLTDDQIRGLIKYVRALK